MRHSIWGRSILLGTVLTTGLLGACAPSEDAESGALELETTAPNRGAVTRVIGATGKVIPRDEVLVGSEVSGRVDEVLVDFNSEVEAGQVIARIDPTNFENNVAQIRGRIASANAEIDVASASIARTRASLEQSRRNMARQRGLFDQDAVSRAQLENAERDVAIGEADLALAEARLVSQQASRDQARAQLAISRADLERTTIRSPIDGVVIDRKIDPGQTVQASFSSPELFVIAADLSQIDVEADIVEADVAGLDPGDPVRFTVDAYPDSAVEGEVAQLRLKSKEENNIVTYVAVITASNEGGRLMPGMTASLDITTDTKPGVLRIPVSAERFRPSPEQIEQFAEAGQAAEEPALLDPVYERLEGIGVTGARLDGLKGQLEARTEKIREVINDPEKSFMHTPMRNTLAEMTDNILGSALEPDERAAYAQAVALERLIRPAEIWVATGDGRMAPRNVRLGLSDGAFVEVVSGLEDDEQVVTGIREAQGPGPQAGPRMGR